MQHKPGLRFFHFMPCVPHKNVTVIQKFNNGYTIHSEKGCWEWNNSVAKGAYGTMQIKGKRLMAHRVSYELFIGEIPKGLFVCHKCDNKPCCNPFHLFIGTQKDNMQDARIKGITPTAPHPSVSAYAGGCRCKDCCALNTEYMKKWRELNVEHKKEYDKKYRSNPDVKARAKELVRLKKEKKPK